MDTAEVDGQSYYSAEISAIPKCHFDNQHIRTWWKPSLDALVLGYVSKWQWACYNALHYDFPELAVGEVDPLTIEEWKADDPLCLRYPNAWQHTIVDYAFGRAVALGYFDKVRNPETKKCRMCSRSFVESSIPFPLLHRLARADNANFCADCLASVFYTEPNNGARKADILSYLQKLADILGIIPSQNFGDSPKDFQHLSGSQVEQIVVLFKSLRPTVRRVKVVFGSWLNALIKAGILEDGLRETPRGTQCLAKDGHVCLSLGEKSIDDYLFDNAIPHSKEDHYPQSNLRSDFTVKGVFIEYFGLAGNEKYDKKTKEKKDICRRNNIPLIAIYPRDLVNIGTLKKKLGILIQS
jgi:hypothetical protein